MGTTDIEIALERLNENSVTFEKLAADILQVRGYMVEKTTEGIGSDGGKDIILRRGDQRGVGHVSARKDWESKVEEGAQKMDTKDESYDFMVFVTNQKPKPPIKEEEKEKEVEQSYGWPTTIISQGTLRSMLTVECPELAVEHLGVNAKTSTPDPIGKIEDLRDERIERIKARDNLPNELPSGPCVAFHLFPIGMFSMDYETLPSTLPSPPFFGMPEGMSKTRGDGVISIDNRFGGEHPDYVYLSEEGYIEGVSTEYFLSDSNPYDGVINAEVDRAICTMLESCLHCLEKIGASTPIYAYVSLLGVNGFVMNDFYGGNQLISKQRAFPEDYTPKPSVIDNFEDINPETLRPTLDRIWHEAGRENGSPWLENIN